MNKTFPLSTGGQLPVLGLGTYRATSQEEVNKALQRAVDELGYRNLDTAYFYKNEHQIGEALQQLKTPRKELFITTKLWVNQLKDEQTIRDAVKESLSKLQTDYIDLMLIHWPYTSNPSVNADDSQLAATLINAWKVFEALYKEGVLKNIGVSNFLPKDLDFLLKVANIKPSVNEIEYHPMLDQDASYDYCKKHNIQLIGYRAIYEHRNHPVFTEIAKEVGKSSVQVLLRWGIQKGVAMIPKSTHHDRLKQNTDVFDFTLSEEQMKRISALKTTNTRYCCDPHSKKSLDTLLTL